MVQLRYRYRIADARPAEQALAPAFGCARVVFNDCLGARQVAHESGVKLSDTDVQVGGHRSEENPGRVWLGDVASVVLVQVCQGRAPGIPELVRFG